MKGITLEQLKGDKKLLYDFIDFFFGFKLYSYQIDFLHKCLTHNRVYGKWARQTGKSQTIAIYILLRALFEEITIIIVSPVQNQSNELLLKVKQLIDRNPDIRGIIKRETQEELIFNTKARILSLPVGNKGATIRGYTCTIAICEESELISDDIVNGVIIPMLASKKDEGQVIKIGTPLNRNHFYHSCFEDPNYVGVNITWKEAVAVGQYSQKFIDEQKAELTDIQFKTEYESEFIDEGMMFFPFEMIRKASATYSLLPQI